MLSRRTAKGFFSKKLQTLMEPSLEHEAKYLLQGEISIELIIDLCDFNVTNRIPVSADQTLITLLKNYLNRKNYLKLYIIFIFTHHRLQ